jgi:hypothetical protein
MQAKKHVRVSKTEATERAPGEAMIDTFADLREVPTRQISDHVSNELWGRAAGRCQFRGCNQALWKSPVTQERLNIGERAHIYSFSERGPRGNKGLKAAALNQFENLLLVCQACHTTIDREKDGGRYTVELIQSWKQAHQDRVELVTGIDRGMRSHVLHYGANIGKHSAPLAESLTLGALFPHRYPAERPACLSMINSAWEDRSADFWRIEEGNLLAQYEKQVRPRLAMGEVAHVSVFGLAPQPLLILLGTQLTDIVAVDVYPLLREPQGWGFAEKGEQLSFRTTKPPETKGAAALVVGTSATVTQDRITSVLGPDAAIWELTLPDPHNDALRTREQLGSFRRELRSLLNKIKAAHGQSSALHIFPATSVAGAIELGRVRMPKADMPWQLYDQVNARGGFVPALRIPEERTGGSP